MSQLGLGRVKTPTFNLRVEIPSRFRKFENSGRRLHRLGMCSEHSQTQVNANPSWRRRRKIR